MRTRARLIPASLFLAGLGALAACSGGTAQTPSIGITPTPTTTTGPVLFSVVRVNTDAPVVWSLAGPGSLSGTDGSEVTYAPPQVGATGSATLTATAGALTASVTFNVAPPALAPGQIPGLSAPVEISYDPENIPHVSCAAMNDCLAAQGYLQAHNRLFQMDLFRRTARGQLASLLGAIEVSSDEEFLTFFTTRDGQRVEDAIVANFDSTTAARTAAYVSGINEYIAELKATPNAPLPDEYAQLPYPLTAADIPDWTAQDTVAIGRLQQFQLSETIEEESGYGMFAAAYGPGAPLADPEKMNAWIRAQETERSYTLPIAGAAAARTPAAHANPLAARLNASLVAYAGVLAQARAKAREARGLLGTLGVDTGSNNWVVDGAHTATGAAMVANDPHLQLQYPPLFHLIAMTASDSSGLDLQGGAFPGLPGVLIGRGKHVGWGDTVVGYDVTDLYLEQVEQCTSGGQIPCAHYTGAGGTQVQLLPVTVAIQVRGPAGLTAQPYTVLVNPMHGPFISYDQPSGNGVSMRWTGQEPTNNLPAFLNLGLATAVGQVSDVGGTVNTAFAALHAYDTGAQNFVLADDQGNIGYDPHALVPKRPWVGTTGYPWFPLPGDGSAEWGSGDASDNCAGTGATPPSANCWYADADLPHADASNSSNTGFLVTANSDPAGYGDTNVPVSIVHGAPFYLSFDWDDPTGFRHKRITTLLAGATAGGGKVSVATMQAIQTDHVSSLAGAFIPDIDFIAAAAGSQVPPAFTAAVAMLDAWSSDLNPSALDCPTGLTGTSTASAASTDSTVLANSAACMLFHVFLRTLLNNVFDDDLAIPGVDLDSGYAIRGMLYMLDPANLGTNTDQSFCNNVDSNGQPIGGTTSCATQVVIALTTAYETLAGFKGAPSNWLWGQAHTLTTVSPASPIVDGTFGAGPYARPGGALTVDVGNPSLETQANPFDFSYGSGSNLRYIAAIDPVAPTTLMQLPGPERDGPEGVFASSPDLIGQYAQNLYFPFLYSTQIAQGAVETQTFTAAATASGSRTR